MSFDTRILVRALREKQLKLALAESVTGGIATQRIANCKGASEILAGSVICYTPEVKMTLMCVPQKKIDTYTCESKEVTHELVKGLEKLIKADVYAAVTGLASEGGSESPEKPVGTVFFSVKYKKTLRHYRSVFKGNPLEIRIAASAKLHEYILGLLWQ